MKSDRRSIEQRRGSVPAAQFRAENQAAAASMPLQRMVDQSPRMVAQRNAIGQLFSSTTAQAGAPASRADAGQRVGTGVVQLMNSFRTVVRSSRGGGGGFGKRFFSQGGGGGGGKKPPFFNPGSSHANDGTPSKAQILMERLRRKLAMRQKMEENKRRLQQSGTKLNSSMRFMDMEKERDYESPVRRKSGEEAHQATKSAVTKYPDLEKQLRLGHETGRRHEESPYISTLTNLLAGATSGSLDEITSSPPDVALVQTGDNELFPPMSSHGKAETEHLALVDDLQEHVVGSTPNPLEGGILRLSRITPELLEHMQASSETEQRLSPPEKEKEQDDK